MTDEEKGSLQICFDRRPPAGTVGDGDRSDLTEAAGAVDEYIERVGLGLDRGEKAFDLRFIAHMRFNAGKVLCDGGEAVCPARTNEDPMSLFGERMRDCRANARTGARDQ